MRGDFHVIFIIGRDLQYSESVTNKLNRISQPVLTEKVVFVFSQAMFRTSNLKLLSHLHICLKLSR